jgi:hypothetical protein
MSGSKRFGDLTHWDVWNPKTGTEGWSQPGWALPSDPTRYISKNDAYWNHILDGAREAYGDPNIHYSTDSTGEGRRLVFGDGTNLPADGTIVYHDAATKQNWAQNDDGTMSLLGADGQYAPAPSRDGDGLKPALPAPGRGYRSQKLELTRRRGSQVTLWRALNPGTETTAALHEIRNPSTTNAFAKFVPLLATSLGNNVGVPLGETITSPGLREIVLNDLIGAPGRDNPGNLVIGGSPGRGKSLCAKNLIRSWLELGAGIHLIDPTDAREHQTALSTFDDNNKVIIDATHPHFSLDGLRIFPFEEAAQRTIDHLLPQMGYSPVSPQAARLKGLLAPASRHANGVGSLNQLIGFLQERRPDRVSVDDDLLIALEGLRAERLLAPMFDDSLPCPDLSKQLVIWNFGGLKLPTVTEEYQAHRHHQTTPSQRAAQALYGMAAELAQSLFFSRDTQPDILVVEECAAWTHSPGGQKCANTLIRQGRKAWTLFVGISQSPRTDFGVVEDEFIEQRICLGFKDATIAQDTLRWCNRDLDRHPGLLSDYVTNTSPAAILNYGDDSIDPRHGKVISGREGEAWVLDEFGGWGKVRLFSAPTRELAQLYDTNPQRKRVRRRTHLSA